MDAQETALQLNEKFHSESLSFGFWENSQLPTAFINNKYCKGAVTLYGAHILSYVPTGKSEVLMLSKKSPFAEPKAIRGGIPLCWPWFGPVPQPTHGIARTQFWDMTAAVHEADGSDTLVFMLSVEQPHRLDVMLNVNFGASLTIALTTVNQGTAAYTLTDAIHTYFKVNAIEKTFIHGLGGAETENRVNNTEFVAEDGFGFSAETDNIYHSEAAVTIDDQASGRKILVEKKNSGTTVVWNPWIEKSKRMADFDDEEYHGMVCVEAANCSIGKIELAPGEKHTLIQKITVL